MQPRLPTIIRGPQTLIRQIVNNKIRITLTFSPGNKDGTRSLTIQGRPPGLFYKRTKKSQGTRQGDHTIAWTLTQKSLEWLLKNITPIEAVTKLSHDFHRDLMITCNICYEYICGDAGAHIHQLLSNADAAHRSMISSALRSRISVKYGDKGVSEHTIYTAIARYLEKVIYIFQYLPFSAVNSNSGGRGEGVAISRLIEIETNKKKNLGLIVESLSTLFDEKAISFQFEQEVLDAYKSKPVLKNLGPLYFEKDIVSYQIMGLFRFLSGFPHINHVLLCTDVTSPPKSPNDETKVNFSFPVIDYNDHTVIENIRRIIFHSKRTSASPNSSKAQVITDALHYIYTMRQKYEQIWENSSSPQTLANYLKLRYFV